MTFDLIAYRMNSITTGQTTGRWINDIQKSNISRTSTKLLLLYWSS